ncbi:MAG: hypothetical protein ABI806_03620 [Candidatus Solibacter sp.]
MQKETQIRKPLMAAPVALLLLGLLAPLAAGPVGGSRRAASLDQAPEGATFAVIGGALCLVSLRLRQRKN